MMASLFKFLLYDYIKQPKKLKYSCKMQDLFIDIKR